MNSEPMVKLGLLLLVKKGVLSRTDYEALMEDMAKFAGQSTADIVKALESDIL